MTIQSSQQAAPATGDEAIFGLKQFAKASNWKVASSGDGLAAYSSTGDVITSASAGANGMGNADAWFRLQAPGGAHEWLFQRKATSRTWTVLFSIARFTGGTPGPSTPPTATDEQTFWDNATMLPADGTYRFNMSLDDASPYGLYAWAYAIGGGGGCTFLFADEPMLAGSYASNDADPYVGMVDYAAGGNCGLYARISDPLDAWAAGRRLGTWYRYGLSGASFRPLTPFGYVVPGATVVPPQGGATIGANAFSGAGEDPVRAIYSRISTLTAPTGWKGMGSGMLWLATSAPVARVTGDVLEIGTDPSGAAYCLAGALWVPWERGVTSLI